MRKSLFHTLSVFFAFLLLGLYPHMNIVQALHLATVGTIDEMSVDTGIPNDFITSDDSLVFKGTTDQTVWTRIEDSHGRIIEGSEQPLEVQDDKTWIFNLTKDTVKGVEGLGITLDEGDYTLYLLQSEDEDSNKSLDEQNFTIDKTGPRIAPKISHVSKDNNIDMEEVETHIIGQIGYRNYSPELILKDQENHSVSVRLEHNDFINNRGNFDVVVNAFDLVPGRITLLYHSADEAGNETFLPITSPALITKGTAEAPQVISLKLNGQLNGDVTVAPQNQERLDFILRANQETSFQVFICRKEDRVCDNSTKIKGFRNANPARSIHGTWDGILDGMADVGEYNIKVSMTNEATRTRIERFTSRTITIVDNDEENDDSSMSIQDDDNDDNDDASSAEINIGQTIGGFVWNDLNKNGIQDEPYNAQGIGEPLAGVLVKLIQNDIEVRVTRSNIYGSYIFSNVLPGNYTLQFEAPEGYKITVPHQGDDDSKDSDL